MSDMASAECPKCSTKHAFAGPRWVGRGPEGIEALEYHCKQCGWMTYRPTHDQHRKFGAESLTRKIAEEEFAHTSVKRAPQK